MICALDVDCLQVWEVESGRQMYQIMDAHGSNVEVTCVTVDESGKRMYTGGYDGMNSSVSV